MAFKLDNDPEGASLVAWTTTPWTLPSNLALCVHPDMTYVKVTHHPVIVRTTVFQLASNVAMCLIPYPNGTFWVSS